MGKLKIEDVSCIYLFLSQMNRENPNENLRKDISPYGFEYNPNNRHKPNIDDPRKLRKDARALCEMVYRYARKDEIPKKIIKICKEIV